MKWLYHYKLTLLMTCFILYALLMPGDSVPRVTIPIPHLDKVVHFGIFFGWTFIFMTEYFLLTDKLPSFIMTLLAVFLFGFATEWMQGALTTSRAYDLMDLLADTIGGAGAIVVWYVGKPYFEKILSSLFKTKRN